MKTKRALEIVLAVLLISILTQTVDPTALVKRLTVVEQRDRNSNMNETVEAYSTPPAIEWNRTYGGTGSDGAFSVVQTSDGGYAVAGRTSSFGAGNWDFWFVKTNATGHMLWNKTYGGTGADEARCVIETSDGGYALTGRALSFGAGQGDAWLVKTDANGNAQWNKTYGGTWAEEALSVVQTSDGGYALAGSTGSYGAGGWDAWLVKTDATGNALWNKTYGGITSDAAYCVVHTSDGGYALAGYTVSFGAGNSDFYFVKTDASGNMLWNKTYGGTLDDVANSVVQMGDGQYALAGQTKSFGVSNNDFYLVKTDASGNLLWNKTYGGTYDEWARSVVQTSDGGYMLAGCTGSFGAGSNDVWLVDTDSTGGMLWNKTCGGTGMDEAWSVVQTSDKAFSIAGYTASSGAGNSDFWLIKLNVPPEPCIIEPLNSGLLYRPAWDAIVVYEDFVRISAGELNLATDIASTLFEYSQNGINWITIGTDNTDAFEGFLLEGGEDIKVGNEGWSIDWNVTGFAEGLYYIRATMTDKVGETGSDQKQVYYDPTPSKLDLYPPAYGSTINGLVEFWATTPDEDIVYMNLSHCDIQADYFDKGNLVGHQDQHNVGPNDPNHPTVNRWCAPTATKNALDGLAKADPGLLPPKGGNLEMARELAKKMGTTADRGTNTIRWYPHENVHRTDAITPGIEWYLRQRNRGCENASGYTVTAYKTTYRLVNGRLVPQSSEATWEAYERELRKCEAVVVDIHPWNWGPDNTPGTNDDSIGGGHAITGRSANGLTNPDGSHDSGFVDPGNGRDFDTNWREDGGFSSIEYPAGSGQRWLVNGIWAISPKVRPCHPIGIDVTPVDGLCVVWDTTTVNDGFYMVTATVMDSAGNCGSQTILVYVNNGMPVHDVALTNVMLSKTVVGQTYTGRINVTVANQGDYTETFNVTVYANTTSITTQTVTLTSGNSTTITFTWNTTDFAKGNYTISAYAWPVPGETDTTDNMLVAPTVIHVVMPGDADLDKVITILDLVKVTSRYAAKKGDQNYDPNVDWNDDGKIDILDVVIVTSRYAQKDP